MKGLKVLVLAVMLLFGFAFTASSSPEAAMYLNLTIVQSGHSLL
jgi:hypothetical protein